jgi:hypothetical protein
MLISHERSEGSVLVCPMRRRIGLLLMVAVLCPVLSPWPPTAHANFGERLWTALASPLQLLRLWTAPADEVLAMPVHGAWVRAVADTWGAPRVGGRRHRG